MTDNDSMRGRGRGTGRGINRGRGRGRGRGTTNLPQPSSGQPSNPSIGQSSQPFPSQTPIAPQVHESMPSPHLSFAGSPHVPFTPSPSHPPTDVASGSSPHIGTASSVISTPQFGSRDIDGRVWIRPGPQNTFDPHHPTRDVLKIIKGKFEGCFESYGEAKKKDEQMVNMWYGEFKRKYKWLPEHERQIKKAFDHKASDGLTNAMYRVRNKIDNGSWIPPEIREQLERKWSQEDWKAKKTSPDLSPSYWDLFQKTHRIKSDNTKWVSSKSEMIAAEYQRRVAERDSQETLQDNRPANLTTTSS